MTEYITALMVGIFQVILSICLIVRRRNGIAIASEIISSIALLCILNELSNESCYTLLIWTAILEYFSVKLFLVVFMLIARYYSFYRIKKLSSNNKKNIFKKCSFLKAIYNAKYWPIIKLGLPEMANKIDRKTGVIFDSKGFPKFKVYYTVKLRKKYFRESRARHFYMANKILYDDIFNNSRLKRMFTKSQINELSEGKTPTGYTWHHHQDTGVLQLVNGEIHAKTWHHGGYSIWGGE